MSLLLLNCDAMRIPLADQSVHCIVTSPPYWGLRDYGLEGQLGLESRHDCLGWATGDSCGACYVCHTRQWAGEVWRVLRDDGTFWLVIGDSYVSNPGDRRKVGGFQANPSSERAAAESSMSMNKHRCGLKPKNLVGIPWRVAFALQADGWYLRSDIIWAKPNPMPESVTDRPTKAHEYVFLLTKSQRYYYDQEAIKERSVSDHASGNGYKRSARLSYRDSNGPRGNDNQWQIQATRNRRTVWTIATQPYKGAHFATFPPALVESCIKAGTSERGVCPACGRPWERVVEKTSHSTPIKERRGRVGHVGTPPQQSGWFWTPPDVREAGWRPSCPCPPSDPIPATVLDPFCGSGTTLLVARNLGRDAAGCDLSWPYLYDQARKRLELDRLAAWHNGPTSPLNL